MTTSEARVVDPVATELARGYKPVGNVGNLLFPLVSVPKRGGKIVKFGKEQFRRVNIRRAPGAKKTRINFPYSAESWSLVQDAVEVPVPFEVQEEGTTAGVSHTNLAPIQVAQTIHHQLEIEHAEIATDPANYVASNKVTLSGTDQWNDAGSDPIGDIKAGRRAILNQTGVAPNIIVMGGDVYDVLTEHPKITDRVKHTSGLVTTELLARLFGVERVEVGEGLIYDEDAGTTATIWGKNVVIAFAPQSPQSRMEPSFGYTYVLEGHPQMDMPYIENSTDSSIHGGKMDRRPYQVGSDAGYLITAAIA